ncbi:carbohydrate ABC transporter permease [Actinomycetaceae bacterium WB03_NA08]|uniref:Carbohydrate ABC transporter permease n=1 Tax=Scrofimicrobium canadense TaxID=2652290 RepID=A0A6N7VQE2_9ACTO|nr:carbohydrate ABC transporter permease [Scrofimicrobium canadense]MSS83180.1 carbohydrate ABC transporter permease [Scrofimicrobium canadense]
MTIPTQPTSKETNSSKPPRKIGAAIRFLALLLGSITALFPFYTMVMGALQKKRDTSLVGMLPNASNMTLDNFAGVNKTIDLGRSMTNSLIITLAVMLCTVVFGLLVGYALAVLKFRGQGLVFALVLLVQAIPFQLLMIPLYVMIVRYFGLADSYLGMVLPFAINSVAVLIFRQYFLQIPKDIFDAARVDGASEVRILVSIAAPLVRPAILTAMLVTFIGPWNEFLWPFLVTKNTELQPLAVTLANFSQANSTFQENPMGAVLAGACVLALPAVILFIIFQRHFTSANLGSAIKG